MIQGKDAWNRRLLEGMGQRTIGHKNCFTFLNMESSFYEILVQTESRYAEKVAFYDDRGQAFTYADFKKMVDYFANYLNTSMGVKKGDHVGILLHTGIEFCVAFYALCKLGAVTVPFPSKFREPEICALVEKSDLYLLISAEDFQDWISSYESRGIKIIYSVDEDNGYGFRHLKIDEQIGALPAVGLTDEVIMMFTSGTTSASKGVVLKNYNVVHAVMIYQRICGVTADDKTILPVPIYHVTGLIALLGMFVYIGGTVYLQRRYDPEKILTCVQENEITFMHGSPTVFSILLDYRKQFPSLPSMRTMLCGSSYMPVEKMKEVHRWMPNMQFQTVFGMTETASPGTIFPYDAATSIYSSSAGKPIPGMDLRVVGEKGEELGPNETGIVQVRGANISEYYYHLQSDLFSGEWLDTGDMGYFNEDRYVFFVGRKKDMINRGGEKIWSNEVEEALISLKEIKDAAVVGIPNSKYGEVSAAVVVLEDGAHMTCRDIREQLMSQIARYKIPEKVLFVDHVPKTPGLKTDKNYIRTMFKEKPQK